MASGKNVEPEPIESAIQCSGLVKHAILLGQDKRELGALVFPDEAGGGCARLPSNGMPALCRGHRSLRGVLTSTSDDTGRAVACRPPPCGNTVPLLQRAPLSRPTRSSAPRPPVGLRLETGGLAVQGS
eukprot:359101-Chlamydomonas_euryale.AAC.6